MIDVRDYSIYVGFKLLFTSELDFLMYAGLDFLICVKPILLVVIEL